LTGTTDVLGRRIAAALLDLLLLAALFVVLGLLLGDSKAEDGEASINLNGLPALIFFALTFLYYGLTEARTGQTLGKRLLGLRVVRTDGSRPAGGAIAARTVLRIVDGLPVAYLLGLIVVLATGKRRQRIGDLAGDTTVVRV
jgi:uncharacterized RDD family membrane protein YckC